MVGRGRGGRRGRGRKRKGPGRITVKNNISSIPNASDEKKETVPGIGMHGEHILVQINRNKQINKILKSTNVSNKPNNLSNPQDHSETEINPAVGYNFRPRERLASTPSNQTKNINVMKNTDSSYQHAAKIIDIEKKPEKAPSVMSGISHRSYLSEMIPFSFKFVPDKRYDDYIPLDKMLQQIRCEGSIDSSDDGISQSSDEQVIQTGVEPVKKPFGIASSPHGSAFEEYDFTTEEEDRLLQDSGEEDFADVETTSDTSGINANQQNTNLSLSKEPSVKEVFKSKDIILRSDNNITIRAFSSDIFKQNINEVITPKYNTRPQSKLQHRPIRKKFKWDYHPDVPVKLFSQDTGYESDNSDDRLKTCDERACSPAEQPNSCFRMEPNNSNESGSYSSGVTIPSEKDSFKVPSLPPVKRPPSRPKKSEGTSTRSSDVRSTSSTDRQNNKQGGDPSQHTSINNHTSCKWTGGQKRIVTGSKDKRQTTSCDDSISIIASSLGGDHDVGNLIDVQGLNDGEMKTESDDFANESLLGEKRPFIENWVADVNSAAPTEWNTPPSTDSVDFRPEQRQADIQKNGTVALVNNKKNNTQSGNDTFYKDMYPVFLLAFGHHKLINELISCTQDLFMLQSCIDVAEGIEFVVRGLERSGLTFLEAVEKISYNIMSRQSHLKSNWEVMKRVIKARGHVSPDLASNILLKATNMYPPDKSLCKDVYTVIVEQKMTEVSQLEPKYLIPIRMLVTTSMSKETLETGNSQEITNPRENLQEHINTNLQWQREIFEGRYSPKNNQVNSPPSAPVPLFNSPVRVVHHSLSPRPHSSGSNHSRESGKSSYMENTNSIRSHYVPQVMPRQGVPEELTLTPEDPIVGKANYRADYEMNVSLHNLLPDSLCHVDMNESDVAKLNEAIIFTEADAFLSLLEQHKSKQSVKKFITMAVAHLRSCRGMYKTFMDLINAIIEINPDFATTPYKKGIMEVIVFNLLHTIQRKGQWKQGANMVAKFCDWDSLVSSKVFPYEITHMGRYIYLARILVAGENFAYTYEILQCPNAESTFTNMMVDLINENKITELGYLSKIPDIQSFCNHMDDHVLRSYTALMSRHLPLTVTTKLYEICCARRIYPSFQVSRASLSGVISASDVNIHKPPEACASEISPRTTIIALHKIALKGLFLSQGTETLITFYCNTLDEEIYLVLHAFFHKVMTRVPQADVTIKIAIPNAYPPYPDNIKLVRCVKDINIVVRNMLKDKFNIVIKDEHPECAAWILVKTDQILECISNLR
nr:unnamed protein product [Callosobruchus analis]